MTSRSEQHVQLMKLDNIVKTYHVGEIDVPVLKGVSLAIARGELVALMGASGSGKSTLMNILGCLDRPTSGQYWLDGEEISALSSDDRAIIRSRKIGFVFQSFNLLARTTALENVMMPLTYAADPVPDREAKRRAKELLERVAIARSLVNNPPLLLADEPTGNLDSRTGEEVLQMFQHLNDEGLTIILVTHDVNVTNHAKRTIRMRDGLIESGGYGVEYASGAAPAMAGGAA